MDGGSPASTPSDANNSTQGVAKFLTDLPSRGLFSSTVPSSQLGGLRVYICDHDTSPPEDQLIKTNQTNILIRSLMLKNQKGESSSKEVKGTYTRKRAADKVLDKASGKKAMTFSPLVSQADIELMSLKVERLRALLKEKGLSVKGKKDELIARLTGADS